MKQSNQFTSIGGQAVIEGVMMRSPHFLSIAVRKPDQKIVIRDLPYKSINQKFPILRKPVLRGIVTLIESMSFGMNALSFSAQVAAEAELAQSGKEDTSKEEALSRWAIAGSMIFAFAAGMGFFVALPHFLTALITSSESLKISVQSPLFHLIDGGLKMLILVTYVYLISLMKDVRRVFQYHGAEHKSIYAFEAGEDLTVENARKYTTLHPRCGTSFLLFLVFISVLVFSVIFPAFGLTELTSNKLVNHGLMIVIKIGLMLPVAGIAYEFIKACALRLNNPIFKMMVWPGLVLQNLTTKEPTDDQLEVALASLRRVLLLEKNVAQIAVEEEKNDIEISQLSDLGWVHAQVAEFPEI